MEKPTFVYGVYSFKFVKRKHWGRKRLSLELFKGPQHIGFIAWHPAAKQLVVQLHTCVTGPLLNFIRPLLAKEVFYRHWRMCGLKFGGH